MSVKRGSGFVPFCSMSIQEICLSGGVASTHRTKNIFKTQADLRRPVALVLGVRFLQDEAVVQELVEEDE